MNSRRRMSDPKLRRRHLIGSNEYFDRGWNQHQNHCRNAPPMSLLGQQRPICGGRAMSAPPRKATEPLRCA